MSKDEIVKMAYDASLTTLGSVAIGVVTQKVFKADLGVPMSGLGMIKMAGAIAGGTAIVNYAETKKWIPTSATQRTSFLSHRKRKEEG